MANQLSPEAQKLWQMSEEYVPLALKYLNIPEPHNDTSVTDCFDAAPEIKRTHFLFPGLPEKTRMALAEARMSRWHSGLLNKRDQEQKTVKSGAAAEQVESAYAARQIELVKHLRAFSPVQQEIIKAHYLVTPGQDAHE